VLNKQCVKGLKCAQLFMELHLTAKGHYLPYRITVLPATQHKWTHPSQTCRYSIYPPPPWGIEGWVQ